MAVAVPLHIVSPVAVTKTVGSTTTSTLMVFPTQSVGAGPSEFMV